MVANDLIGRAGLLGLALLAPLGAQEHARWVKALGDPKRSEAAERSLIAMGAGAVPVLALEFENWNPTANRERCLALLRVVRLLGRPAAELASAVKRAGLRDEKKQLMPELATTLASLEPHAGDSRWSELFHHGASSPKNKELMFASFVRMNARRGVDQLEDLDALREELRKDRVGAREVAAECLAELGDEGSIDSIHARLLDRERMPDGWDQIRHNGFVLPLHDEFALRAGEALIRLAPRDPRAAIGYANRALHHPHRTVRIEALREMAQLGPAVAEAVPELMTLAKSGDPAIATLALKMLGLGGRSVGVYLRDIDTLAESSDERTQRAAKGLSARLRAMGCEPASLDLAGLEDARELRRLVDSLNDESQPAVVEKVAAHPGAWQALMDRFRKESADTPVVVFDLLVEIAWTRTAEDRETLRYRFSLIGTNTWEASSMSTSSPRAPGPRQQKDCARLSVDPDTDPVELLELLTDANPYLRQAAIEVLATRSEAWSRGTDVRGAVRDKLIVAATTEHPTTFDHQVGPHHRQKIEANLTPELQTAAAVALAGCRVPAGSANTLLAAVLRSDDEAAVVRAIGNWACPAATEKLTEATHDSREAVAAAARAALQTR